MAINKRIKQKNDFIPGTNSNVNTTNLVGLNKYQTAYNNFSQPKNNAGIIQQDFAQANAVKSPTQIDAQNNINKYTNAYYQDNAVKPTRTINEQNAPEQSVEETIEDTQNDQIEDLEQQTETNPLKNAYDSFKAQAELNKVSAQNELSNANKVAQQYMDNYLKYYGMQGSGMGQSAYANLAAQNTRNAADINKQYNQELADYRNAFNENLKEQAALDLQSLSKEDQQSYIDKLRGQSGVNDDTISNIEAQANSINYQRNEDRQSQLNDEAKIDGRDYAMTYNETDWSNYINDLQAAGVDENTIKGLERFRNAYGVSLDDSKENALSTVIGAIDSAVENKDYDKQRELNTVYDRIENATTQEELDTALEELKQVERKGYGSNDIEVGGSKTYKQVNAQSGSGSKNDPYVYDELKLKALKKLAENETLPEGSWVQYTNSVGNVILRQVIDGKLKKRERVYEQGHSKNPYANVSNIKDLENMVENGEAKVGDYYYITNESGKKVRYRVAETMWGYKYLKED